MTVGDAAALLVDQVVLEELRWVGEAEAGELLAQTSAHGTPQRCRVVGTTVMFTNPVRRVAPGQSVVLYANDEVVAGGIVA